jgi:hypothetical protein
VATLPLRSEWNANYLTDLNGRAVRRGRFFDWRGLRHLVFTMGAKTDERNEDWADNTGKTLSLIFIVFLAGLFAYGFLVPLIFG